MIRARAEACCSFEDCDAPSKARAKCVSPSTKSLNSPPWYLDSVELLEEPHCLPEKASSTLFTNVE